MRLWQWSRQGHVNFGDEITLPLVQLLLGGSVEAVPLAQADLVGAGSTMGTVVKTRHLNIPYIWGTGFMWPGAQGAVTVEPVDRILAVRGELSLARLGGVARHDVVLGDPGLLASLLINQRDISKEYSLGLVPHYVDKQAVFFNACSEQHGTLLIDVERDPSEVVMDIARCRAVLSSSLHGLVVADSLGIPNRRVAVSDKVSGGSFKFFDYASVFPGRDGLPALPSDFDGMSAAEISHLVQATYEVPDNLAAVKLDLIGALLKAFR